MRIKINNTEHIIPSSLHELTLGQKIAFQEQYGETIQAMHDSCIEIEDEDERELELAQLGIEKMFMAVSFYTGYTIEELKASEFIDKIASIYWQTLAMIEEEEKDIESNQIYEFTWKGDIWFLHVPELKNGDKMTYGEFIDAKQIIQDMSRLGKNRWESLLPLCAIFLRRKDEAYEEAFLFDKSERIELMRDLPMSIAYQVGFFLSNSLSMWLKLFPSSGQARSKELVAI